MAYEALYTRARPKTLSQLVGQEHISNALARAISADRLSHAYLLVGTRGTGKTSTARLLAKAINCDTVAEAQESHRPLDRKEIPCNKCEACKNFSSSPDNFEFDAASNRSVEDITRLLSSAYLAPLASRNKTYIIDEIHMLSNEAINSILKLIEEPPPRVTFFLATTEINKVPMTIRSRCQILNFRLIAQERIASYLDMLAGRLDVKLHEDAAKKIARLAAGSMRDALTYLDQCYAMGLSEISLDAVNETLGLVSDESLDKIISAVKNRDRAAVAQAVTAAFRSGLPSNLIVEALITRLRDMEFAMLNRNERNFSDYDAMIDALRKSTSEMYGSGIPDIILEMTLMKLATPVQAVQNFQQPAQVSAPPSENLDAGRKIFYDVINNADEYDDGLKAMADKALVLDFTGDKMTLGFKSEVLATIFENNNLASFEQAASQIAGRDIKISVVVDPNMPPPVLDRLNEPERTNLVNAMKFFHATDAVKV